MADADEITTPAEAKHTLVKLVQELHRVLSALRGMDAPVHDFTLDAMQETIGDRLVKDLKNFTASYNRHIAKRDELTVLINALTVRCSPLLSPTPTPFFSSRSPTSFLSSPSPRYTLVSYKCCHHESLLLPHPSITSCCSILYLHRHCISVLSPAARWRRLSPIALHENVQNKVSSREIPPSEPFD